MDGGGEVEIQEGRNSVMRRERGRRAERERWRDVEHMRMAGELGGGGRTDDWRGPVRAQRADTDWRAGY